MLFGVSPKTHEPAKHLVHLIDNPEIPETFRTQIKHILPDFIKLGVEEHFMTDYGDETSYRLPWDIFDEESALSALDSARMCRAVADEIIDHVHEWRSGERT